ncbi:hypothetical protein QTP70_005680 [Hemibagrus guttatus]|uniref:Uncharacterized protein n=1 Tax=Hemibagrus guttatus TaxID=175788 RepID=A0AAE0Q9R1_9TELE|nr:hypothetical protein QTP70_005680 [Hemibagrus guttatus]
MLRFSLGVTRLYRIRNEYIRGTAHVGRLGDKVREARSRWFGHVQRREKLGRGGSSLSRDAQTSLSLATSSSSSGGTPRRSQASRKRHPKQMPEPPQLPPFDVEEQRLYSELLPGDRALYPISKGAPRHPTEEAHFGRLYPGSYPFGHDPKAHDHR